MAARRRVAWTRVALVANGGALVLLIGAVVAVQYAVARACARAQAEFGFRGCVIVEHPAPGIDWKLGPRRELLWATLERAPFLWPSTRNADVRRGAAQLLLDSAAAADGERVLDALRAGDLSPPFAALHYAKAWTLEHDELPRDAARWLEGDELWQAFACFLLPMLVDRSSFPVSQWLFDPIETQSAAALVEAAYKVPLADVVSQFRGELARSELRPRSRAAARAELEKFQRVWSFF